MDEKRMVGILMTVILLSGMLAGCILGPIVSEKDTIKVKDGLDREVMVKVGVKRIVSLAPSNTEILYALDLGAKVVAVDNNTNYPKEAMDKPQVSGYKWLDMETILALRPDLVLGADINKDIVPQLEAQGLTVVILAPNDIQDVFDDIRLVGKMMDVKKRSEELASSLEERVKEITDVTLADEVARPRVYLELDVFMGYYTYGANTFGDELISLSGGNNIAGAEPNQYPSITDEYIIASDPEVIIYQLGPWTSTTPEGIKARNGWGNITAVKEDDLFGVDGDLISRPGPRIVDGLVAIAKAVHPELVI